MNCSFFSPVNSKPASLFPCRSWEMFLSSSELSTCCRRGWTLILMSTHLSLKQTFEVRWGLWWVSFLYESQSWWSEGIWDAERKTPNKRHFLSVFAHPFLLPVSSRCRCGTFSILVWGFQLWNKCIFHWSHTDFILLSFAYCFGVEIIDSYNYSFFFFFKITKAFGVLHLECLTASVPSS